MGRMAAGPGHRFVAELRTIAMRGRQVWSLVPWSRRLSLAGAVGVMNVAAAASIAIPVLLGQLLNTVEIKASNRAPQDQIWKIAAYYLSMIGLAYLTREVLNVLRRFLVESTTTRIDKEMCVRLVGHLMTVDLSAYAHEQVGAIHGRITRSVEGFVRFLRIGFLDFFPAVLTGTFALIAALSKSPRVALVMAGVIPISVGLTIWQLLTQKGVRIDLLRGREAIDGTVVEQLSGIDYVRAADTLKQEVRRVERAAEWRRAKELRHHFEMSLFGCGKALNEGLFHLMVIAFSIYLFLHGGIEHVGDIIMFSGLFLSVMAPLNEIHRFLDEAHESSLRVGDLVEMLEVPVDRSFVPANPMTPHLELGKTLFSSDSLEVQYRTSDGRLRRALNGLTVNVTHGETIGVAGRSGCGKSTWLRALMRLVHPSGGSATLGGVPLESVSRESIGELIGYVGQNPFVFAGTIAENIAYGREGASPDQIRHAAEMACIHDEILALPGGYDARVAERGQNLSGGQRQRLALARVFLKNPPILILDEGTSALDNISERKVQRAIDAAREDRTVILVAHRLSTLRSADRILVFDDGRVVETGRYNALVRRGGVFADLVLSGEFDPEAATSAPAPVLPPDPLPMVVPSNDYVHAVVTASLLDAMLPEEVPVGV